MTTRSGTITMTMRELDRFKVIQAIVDMGLSLVARPNVWA